MAKAPTWREVRMPEESGVIRSNHALTDPSASGCEVDPPHPRPRSE